MKSLFLAQSGRELKDTLFLEYAPSAHRNMKWDSLAPYERMAIDQYLRPYLGEAFVEKMVAYANRDEAAEPEVASLQGCLYHLRLAVAWYMSYDALVDQNVQITDLGAQQQSASEGGSQAPSQWAFKNKRWNLISKADKFTDQLLDFLEERARTQDAEFSFYIDDAKRRRQTSDFFQSTTEVDEYLNIEGSRRAWANMVPSFRDAEWKYLKPVLGEAFYNELSIQYKAGTSNYAAGTDVGIATNVLKQIQRVVAKYGLMIAIPNISCVIQGNGIIVVSQRDGFDQRVSASLSNSEAVIARLQQSTEGLARTAMADLRAYIIRNADGLPTYKNSTAFPVAAEPQTIIGDVDSGAHFL